MEIKIEPRTNGVYRLFSNNEVVYVGMSADIGKRIKHHWLNKNIMFDDFLYTKLPVQKTRAVERSLIRKFKPKYNISENPDILSESISETLEGSVNKKISGIMIKEGISIYQLAKSIGESDQTTRYIVKTKNFTRDYLLLKKISEALNCTIEDLLEDEDNG